MPSVLSWSLWWMVAVVLVCWGVGAYSRLRRLRAAIAQAFAALAPVWQRRLAWVQARAFPPESEAAQRLIAARGQCARVLEQAREKPLQALRIQSLALAAGVLDAAWAAAAGEALPGTRAQRDASGVTWDALQHQALPLQTVFNAQVERYNRAIAQFPASALACVMRFRHVESLPITKGLAKSVAQDRAGNAA